MVGPLIAVGCRTMVAVVFVLTASWKVSNRHEFELSFDRLAPEGMAGIARWALWPLAAVELALAVVLLVGLQVQVLSLAGPVAAFALIFSFTVALALGEEGGCGCWFTPPSSARTLKLLPIIRNVTLLIALAAAAVLSSRGIHGVGFAAGLAPVGTALILAALLVEAPQIAAAITFEQRPAGVGGGARRRPLGS